MDRQMASVFLISVIVCVLPSAAQPPVASSEVDSSEVSAERENPTGDLRSSPSLMIRGWPDALLGGLVPEGMEYGVGATTFFENQKSLKNTLSRTTVTLRDLDRNVTDTTVFSQDPTLTNIKFDFELELKGAGVQVPLGLPQIPNTGIVSIYPTFVFELSAVDVGFDVFDTTTQPAQTLGASEAATLDTGFDAFAASQQAIHSSGKGSGPMFGLGLDLTARVCTSCNWIANWSYWYRFIPSLDVDRPLGLFPDFDAAFDSLSLTREAHEISSRVGYAVSAGSRRYVPFTGVLYKKTKLEFEDEVSFLEPSIGLETTLESFSRFESETVQALAGFDVQLSKSVFGRLETAFGEGDYGVSFQISWSKGPRPRFPKFPERGKKQTRVINDILAQLSQLRRDFLAEWDGLSVITGADGSPVYSTLEVRSLLERYRDRFLEILNYRQLAAMQSYVAEEIDDMLTSLSEENAPNAESYRSGIRVASSSALTAFGFSPVRLESETLGQESASNRGKSPFLALLSLIMELFADRDIKMDLSVATDPPGAYVEIFTLRPNSTKKVEEKSTISVGTIRNVYRGRYWYLAKAGGEYLPVKCDKSIESCPKLDLIDESGPVFRCSLYRDIKGCCKAIKKEEDLQCPRE